MSEVLIREMIKKDYSFIHDLLYETWYKDESENRELQVALAEIYLNHCLNRSTMGLVAEVDGEQTGFILAKVNSEEPILRQFQTDPYKALLPVLEASEVERATQTTYLKRELEANAEMLEQSKTNFDAEICLFIVSPKVRGSGVGNQLYQKLLDTFKRLDVENYYLYTDDACNVTFYEKRKMYRAQARPFNPNETLEESSFNLYFYQNKA